MSTDKKTNVYGIDLGTTYSAIACINEYGKAEIIKNSEGESVTPSVVFFESPANIIVGTNAKNAGQAGPEAAARVVDFVKREMSSEHWHTVQDGATYGPVEVSSLIIKRLVEDARKTGEHDVRDVVITCPAYFGELERTRTRQAGELAGLNVIEILDEPVAAAINYGLNADSKGKNIIVYDLGGGTFDVTVIAIGSDPDKTEIGVVCTEGDHQLGGKDWDDRIVQFCLNEFRQQTGVDILAGDPQDVHEMMYDLRVSAEQHKKTLTTRGSVSHKMTFDGERARGELTREAFDDMTSDLLERTITLTDALLSKAAEKGVTRIDAFLLVGGSTRMPQVEAKIIEKYAARLGIAGPDYFDVDEAVAKGAAKEAEILKIKRDVFGDAPAAGAQPTEDAIREAALASGRTVAEIQAILNTSTRKVATKSYGIRAMVKDRELGKDVPKACNLIIKQTAVPVTASDRFQAYEDDTYSLPLVVYANDISGEYAELEMCVKVGETIMELPRKLDRGMPLDIQFTLTEEGKLRLFAHDPTHDQTKEAEFVPEGALTDAQFQAALKKQDGLSIS